MQKRADRFVQWGQQTEGKKTSSVWSSIREGGNEGRNVSPKSQPTKRAPAERRSRSQWQRGGETLPRDEKRRLIRDVRVFSKKAEEEDESVILLGCSFFTTWTKVSA